MDQGQLAKSLVVFEARCFDSLSLSCREEIQIYIKKRHAVKYND